MAAILRKLGDRRTAYVFIVALLFLYLAGEADYLLFHTLIELVTIAIAACAFIIAWNGQRLHANSYLLVLGLGFVSVAVLTLAHTLVYKGMHVIPNADLTFSTQLWIASRGVLALSLFVAPLLIGRRLRRSMVLYCYILLTALLFGAIFVWRIFPVTFIEGRGVTLFKTLAEYVICGILGAGLILLWRRREAFDRRVLRYLSAGIIFTIVAELTFSSYINLYGLSNVIGHLLTLVSFSYFYLAIVRTGFSQPLQLLFRDLKEREAELQLSEEKLLQANDLLEAVTQGAEVLIAAIDTDYRYTYFNEAYRRQAKQSSGRELHLGLSLMELFAHQPEQQKVAMERWRHTLQGGSASYTTEFDNAGRYRRVYSVLHTPLRDAEGRVAGAGEVAYDITEQVRAEEALRASEERYRSLFRGMTEGFALHEIICDAQGEPCDYRFLEVNPAFEQLTGLKREAVVGRTLNEVLPGENPHWIATYGRVALTGEPAQFENYSPALKKNYEAFAYRPAPGQFAVVFRDITERKRMESEREMTVEFLRQVNDSRGVADLLRRAAGFFQKHCRCEAVAIRLQRGEDYPYGVSRGFSEAFVEAESPLCARDVNGKILRDKDLNPLLDCLCGQVISGRAAGDGSFFTKRGNFWTNSTTELNASTEVKVLGPLRNRCHLEGYESVALIALRLGEETLGLLQMNDRQPGCFSPEIVALWERLAGYLTVALARARAEENLRESEERLNRGQEIAHLGSWELDLIQNHLTWSDEVYRIFGLAPREFDATYEAFLEAVHPEDRAAVDAAYADSLQNGLDSYEIEHRIIRKTTGEVRIVQERCQHIRDEAGQVIRSVGMVHDVTERKRAEEALRESEQRFKVIASSTPDHLLVQDRELRYSLVVNPQLGITEAEMIGKTDFDLVPREDAEKLTAVKRQVLETGEAVHLEMPVISRKGETEFFEGDYVPKYNAEGEIDGLIGYFRNITARKRAEEQMAWLASFPRQNPTPVVEVEADGKLVYTNPTAQKLLPDLDERGLSHPWLAGLEEMALRFREGKEIRVLRDVQLGGSWYQQLLMPVHEGRRVRIYATEITQRKRVGEALLRERNRMRLLADTAAQLLAAPDPLAAVNELCREVMAFLDCQMFFNFLADEKTGRLHLNAYAGIPEETAKAIEWLDYGVAVCGCVAREGESLVVEHIPTAGDPRTDLVRSFGAKAYACHPIKFGKQVLGTLSFGCTTRETFSRDELDLMSIITDQVALAVVRKRGEQALQEAKAELELRVQERTAELTQTVGALQVEVFEREQAENAAAAERRRFNDVLETVPAYVVLLTPDYHVAYANRVFRERFGESGGRRCYEFLFERREPCEICETYTVMKTRAPHHWEWTGPDQHNYDIYDFPFTDTDGSELILEMGIDITELKVAQQRLLDYQGKLEELVEARTAALETTNAELLAAERAKAQLAETLVSEIGHRTKNNLAIVAGLLQMQMDQEGEKISGPELIRDAVTRILSFASLHEQMYQSQADSIELVDAIKRIAEIDRQALSAGDVEIIVEGEAMNYPSGVGTTLCVVANELLTNALKHGDRQEGGRRVEAKLALAGGELTITVWNSGEALPKNFDIRKRSRTGLGLVHTIVVDQYGGCFTLAPERGGTMARIVLSDARLCGGL